jgi:hypothetical protein
MILEKKMTEALRYTLKFKNEKQEAHSVYLYREQISG